MEGIIYVRSISGFLNARPYCKVKICMYKVVKNVNKTRTSGGQNNPTISQRARTTANKIMLFIFDRSVPNQLIDF